MNILLMNITNMPKLTATTLIIRRGVRVVRWPRDFPAAARGGTYLPAAFCGDEHGRLHATGAPPTYIAVRCGGSWWYGELILSLEASYLGAEELCYVRWLDTVAMRARLEQRTLTAQEAAGPFEAFRWSTSPGSRYHGHPRGGSAHYGVVSCSCVRYRVPMQASILDEPGAADPLFRLNTDMYRFSTS